MTNNETNQLIEQLMEQEIKKIIERSKNYAPILHYLELRYTNGKKSITVKQFKEEYNNQLDRSRYHYILNRLVTFKILHKAKMPLQKHVYIIIGEELKKYTK